MPTQDGTTTEASNGARLRCGTCGAEAIVTKAQQPALTCCGQALEVLFSGRG